MTIDLDIDLCIYISHLEQQGSGCTGEVETLEEVHLWVVFPTVALYHDRLSCALLTNQQNGLLLLGYHINEEVCSYIVHIGNEN